MEEKRGGKIGVLGCSSRMNYILTWLLEENPDHKIVGLYDIEKKSTESYIEKFGEIEIYDDCEALTNNPEIDWIFIGSTNYLHKKYILAALNANKHVFCEKPLAISIEECEEIKKAYYQKNLNFLIGFTLRYSPHYNKIKEMVDNKEIGEIISMEFNETLTFKHGSSFMTNWRRFSKYSGSFLLEKCCHDMDLVNWITKSIPKKVASFGGLNLFKPENSLLFEVLKKDKGDPFTSEKDIVDDQVAIIEFLNGVRATFHLNSSSGIPERRMYICGTKGTIRADVLTGKIEIKKINSEISKIILDEGNKGGHGGGDKYLIKELNKTILDENITKKEVDDAIKSAVTCIAIDKSMNENKIINMEDIWSKFNYNITQTFK